MGLYSSRVNPAIVSRQEQQAFIPIYNCRILSEIEAPGHLREDLPEAIEGTEIALAGRCLLDSQDLGGLGVRQMLEVPQGQDLAIGLVHGVERLLEPELGLGPDGGLARGGQAAQELGGESGGGRL